MRKIYLIRHAKPAFPNNERYCLGRTDMPLGTFGRLQAILMAENEKLRSLNAVYSSTLSRAKETAAFLGRNVTVRKGLEEMYAGEWDGLSFSQIKKQYADIYAARGVDITFPIPGSENTGEGEKRFETALMNIAEASTGDIAVVAHKTVIQSLLAVLYGFPPEMHRQFELPYCSYSLLEYDGQFHAKEYGIFEKPRLDTELCIKLLRGAGADARLEAHCKKVAEKALEITDELSRAGTELDRELINFSSLLHDIARAEADHAARGAKWLAELGYKAQSDIVRQHHDIDAFAINEAAVVNIADKCVSGSTIVPIEERFSKSKAKCSSPQAIEAHRKRHDSAICIKDKINEICGSDVII